MTMHHHIGRVTYDFDVVDGTLAEPLQDRLSDFSYARLAMVIDTAIVDAGISDDFVLDRLALDLGDIPMSELEDTLETRLLEALTLALLQLRLNGSESPANEIRMPASFDRDDSQHELTTYLSSGRYPDWSDSNAPGLAELLQSELRRDPQGVIQTLETLARNPDVRKRLALQLPEDIRKKLIAAAQGHANGSLGLVLDMLTPGVSTAPQAEAAATSETISNLRAPRLPKHDPDRNGNDATEDLPDQSLAFQRDLWQALRTGQNTQKFTATDIAAILAADAFDLPLLIGNLSDTSFRAALRYHLPAAAIEELHLKRLPTIGGFAVTLLRTAQTLGRELRNRVIDASLAGLAQPKKDATQWLLSILRDQDRAMLDQLRRAAEKLAEEDDRFSVLCDILDSLGAKVPFVPTGDMWRETPNPRPFGGLVSALRFGSAEPDAKQSARLLQGLDEDAVELRQALDRSDVSAVAQQRLINYLATAPAKMIEGVLIRRFGSQFLSQFNLVKDAISETHPVNGQLAVFQALLGVLRSDIGRDQTRQDISQRVLHHFLAALTGHNAEKIGSLAGALDSHGQANRPLSQDVATPSQPPGDGKSAPGRANSGQEVTNLERLEQVIHAMTVTDQTALPENAETVASDSSDNQLVAMIDQLIARAGFELSPPKIARMVTDTNFMSEPNDVNADALADVIATSLALSLDTLTSRLRRGKSVAPPLPACLARALYSEPPPDFDTGQLRQVFARLALLFVRAGLSDDAARTARELDDFARHTPPVAGNMPGFFKAIVDRYGFSQNTLIKRLEPHLSDDPALLSEPFAILFKTHLAQETTDANSAEIKEPLRLLPGIPLQEIALLLQRSGLGADPGMISQMLSEIAETTPPTEGNEMAVLNALAVRLDLSLEALILRLQPVLSDKTEHLAGSLAAVIQQQRPNQGQAARLDHPDIPESAGPATTPIHTTMSGLVLTHPYLMTYLERLDCLVDRQLPAENADRAVHLFGLLATGHSDLPEHELTLPKLLAGLAVNMPVSSGFQANSQEVELADELLQHLASQVPGLVNTTPDALRETFLLRHGQITPAPDDSGKVLHVVKGPFDMLLDQIPWPFSVIRLPWMQEALYVEWI